VHGQIIGGNGAGRRPGADGDIRFDPDSGQILTGSFMD